MRFKTTFLTAAALALCALHACADTGHKLYYLDESRNVCVVAIGTNGNPTATPKRLTTGGGYHGYSVSPSHEYVFGWKQVGEKWAFPVSKLFLETHGKQPRTLAGPIVADGYPRAEWSEGGRLLIMHTPQQVEPHTIIYSLESKKVVCDTNDLIPSFSTDEAFAFVLEYKGAAPEESAWLRILDLKRGGETKLAEVAYGDCGEPWQSVWFGDTHKFAFIDATGNVGVGEVSSGKAGPVIKKSILTTGGSCSDIRYVAGKGVYFLQKTGDNLRAYYTSDLKTVSPGTRLPDEETKRTETGGGCFAEDGRVYSLDRSLFAVIKLGKPNEMGMIKVYNKSGKAFDIAKGTLPRWIACPYW